ncbi:MAG: primosomal protein N', partial [Alphaproteobacteria bacterium]|nr:primosomal protein N' [Alphaproteobacteria bacterium]
MARAQSLLIDKDAQPITVSVLLPLPLGGAYDYWCPEGEALAPGDIVTVPLGRREVTGVVWGPGEGGVAPEKMRHVVARREVPRLGETMRSFIDWVADYTLAPPGAVLAMTLRSAGTLEPPRSIVAYRLGPPDAWEDLRQTPARRRVGELMASTPPLARPELMREAAVSAAVIKGLVEAGALIEDHLPPPPIFEVPDWRAPGPDLAPEQAAAAAELKTALGANGSGGGFSVILIDGVTGSGKTEVYFEAVAAALAQNAQVLVLLPEIALTAQWLDRFVARFGVQPAVWHSDVGTKRRRLTWRAVATGEARVVVGARSALFLPFAELGLIIVDEEHEAAFKQEDGVHYHARDMGVVRAMIGDFPAVLASATPSLETLVNVTRGRYRAVHLPARFAGALLPKIEVVDLRADPPPRGSQHTTTTRNFLSQPVRDALVATLKADEQSLLFLNRRGYAPLTLCRACGHRMGCPNCDSWLVEHRFRRRLECHHCGFGGPVPAACPACAVPDALVTCGPGVERIADEVAALLPDARQAMMTSDTVHGPQAAAELIGRIEAHEIDILIGTQMVAKGHHFPRLTLVGVVDADLGLAGGDLRAVERTYQLLHQVAGRAGRGQLPGRVLLQTYAPEHPVMRALVGGDRDAFLAAEAAAREDGGWPPFGRLAALIVSGRDQQAVDATAAALGRSAPIGPDLQVLGPAPAPLAMLRGRHRRRLLVKTGRDVNIQSVVSPWVDKVP